MCVVCIRDHFSVGIITWCVHYVDHFSIGIITCKRLGHVCIIDHFSIIGIMS